MGKGVRRELRSLHWGGVAIVVHGEAVHDELDRSAENDRLRHSSARCALGEDAGASSAIENVGSEDVAMPAMRKRLRRNFPTKALARKLEFRASRGWYGGGRGSPRGGR